MAFDGITIANIVHELNQTVLGGKINKIAQPEADELILTIKNNKTQYRLFLSASASLPLIYLTSSNKPSPLTAPNFCMLLRKHIGSGKIISITQPGLERVIRIEFEHLNELGDLCRKYLIIEIMGKHSNIIFCNEEDMIIDSIKHVSVNMSSVREVLPGRSYFIPETLHKLNPLTLTLDSFQENVCKKSGQISKVLYTTLTGISPVASEEICYRAGIDGSFSSTELSENEQLHLFHMLHRMMEDIQQGDFTPKIVYDKDEPVEYSCFSYQMYQDKAEKAFSSISDVLEEYYAARNQLTRIRQKSAELRRVVATALERCRKKYELQSRQMNDTQKREKYRIYGELINTYGYNVEPGSKSFDAVNYYTNENVTIPLDNTKSISDNAKHYFDKYNKMKRTAEALETYLLESQNEIEHLESISNALEIARDESDLVQLREELSDYGYIRKKYQKGNKKVKITSKPLHYISSDGYHMYVGKNNYQNEELTFKFATGNDWWFHAKGQPGSHVVVKSNNEEMPDRTFEEAGKLAAFYSKGKAAPKVEIDYTQKKNIKKPSGAKPGFVIYYTNYSLLIEPDISDIKEIQ